MKSNNLTKIKFKHPSYPIEIFCSQKYKDYYIRGQIIEIPMELIDENKFKVYGYAFYHFKIFALVNDNYLRTNVTIDGEGGIHYSKFSIFCARTKQELFEMQKEGLFKYMEKGVNYQPTEAQKKILTNVIKRSIKSIEVNINEIGIQEGSYLTNSINKKKDIIPIKMDIHFDRAESSGKKIAYPKIIYHLPICLLPIANTNTFRKTTMTDFLLNFLTIYIFALTMILHIKMNILNY